MTVETPLLRLVTLLRSDRGSATVEFVTLALPLFIPLFIFLGQYSMESNLEAGLRTLSREMARGIVTSENDTIAESVSNEIFFKAGNVLGFKEAITSGELRYEIHCRNQPCISPDNEVTVTLTSVNLRDSVSAVEYVSPWS
jgi:Flp pilus assembly protein TadG